MSSFGVIDTGFAKKRIEDLLSEIEDAQLTNIRPDLNQLPSSVLGQLNGIFADKLRELWDLAQAIYSASYPDSAEGAALDAIAAITGATRLPATRSTVELTVNLNAGVTLPVGRIVANPATGVQFQTTLPVANTGASPANLTVQAESVLFGPIIAQAATLTDIITPVSGWNSVTNALDATPGRNVEADAEFRIRREQLLQISGGSTIDAIRASLLASASITQAIIFENSGDVVDVAGRPPHSFEAVVFGGTDAEVAQIIFENKPAGIQTFGDLAQVVVDSQGVNRTINFSRPTPIDIYIDVTVVTDPSTFPADGADQVAQAIVDFGDALQIGDDVIARRISCAPFDVTGVTDVTVFELDTTPSPTNIANIPITDTEIAVFDTSRITVTVV